MEAHTAREAAGASHPAARLRQLDGLRGFAAVAVMISHLLVSLPTWRTTAETEAVYHSPLRIAFAGSTAVALFFIMSGFVLALPFVQGRAAVYGAYAVRRFFRIYVPYAAAMLAGLVLFVILAHGPLDGFSPWFNRHWEAPLTLRATMHHVLLVGEFNAGEYGLSFWTLVHEMRMSLLFPLVMIPILRLPSRYALVPAAGASVLGALLLERGGYQIVGSSAFPVTMVIALLFSVGALIAKHRDEVIEAFGRLSPPRKLLLVLAGWALALYGFLVREVVGGKGFSEALEFWAITGGGAILIVWLLAGGPATSAFTSRVGLWLGDVSYSLYLVHGVVIFTLAHALHPLLPAPILLVVAGVASLFVASVAHRYVEAPAMRAGKSLAGRLDRRRVVHRPRDPSLELDVRMRHKNELPIRIT